MVDKDFLIDEKIKKRLQEENSLVPENVEQIIKKTGNKLSSKRKSNIIVTRVAAVFLSLVLGVGVFGVTMPSYAKDIPIIGSIFKALDKDLYSKYDNYALNVNKTKESNGVKVTLNDVVYDGVFLCIDYTVEAKEALKIEPKGLLLDLKADGKNIMSLCTGCTNGKFSSDKKTYRGMAEVYLTNINSLQPIDIPDKFKLDIDIKKIIDNKVDSTEKINNEIAGIWNFSTEVTSEKLKGKVKELSYNVNLDKIEKGAKINKLILTPINTILEGTNLKDLNGLGFLVYDDKERVLPFKTIGTLGVGEMNNVRMSFKESYNDAGTLTFIPYRLKEYKAAKLYDAGLNIKGDTLISLGKYGELRITKIDTSNGETKVYYKCKYGSFIAPVRIVDKENGEEFNLKDTPEYLEEKGEYVVSFDKALKDKNYTVQYQNLDDIITIFDDLKFTVDINK